MGFFGGTGIFERPGEKDLEAIARWWQENRPPRDSVVQIDVRDVDFVVPWGILVDCPPDRPANSDDLWGLRYQIEHHLYGSPSVEPAIYSTEKPISFAMMIGAENVGKMHFEQMRSVASRTGDRLELRRPITVPSEALKLFNMDKELDPFQRAPLIYFIGHAYTRKRTMLSIQDGLDMFCKWYDEKPDDVSRAQYCAEAKVFCSDELRQDKYSFFQLEGGTIRQEQKLISSNVNLDKTRPFIFFNACQSAQNSPCPTEGWVHLLMSKGAGGYLGTEVFIDAQFAQAFGQAFWEAILGGMTAGKALLAVRRHFADRKLLQGLAYTHYGPADVRLAESILAPANRTFLAEGQTP
jgi:hypothetical protein